MVARIDRDAVDGGVGGEEGVVQALASGRPPAADPACEVIGNAVGWRGDAKGNCDDREAKGVGA